MTPLVASERNVTLDVLRGLASLAVCWFHLTNGNPGFLPAGPLRASGTYGWLGVEVFFVISGFIIPYALSRTEYRISDYPMFLLKRVLRLDPPYIAAIGLIVLLGYLSSAVPGFRGEGFSVTAPQLLSHLGYLNAFLDYQWLNPVFWTLAIEVQYYLLIGLLFPVVASRNPLKSGALMLLAIPMPFLIPQREYIFHWFFVFMMGFATFRYRRNILGLPAFLGCMAILTALIIFTDGYVVAAAGLATACMIAFAQWSRVPAPLLFLGHISYSLYLLHVPTGGRIVNFGVRLGDSLFVKLAVLGAALAVSIGAAWVLYRIVELPAQRWSASVGYRKGKVAPSGFAPRQG